MGLPKPATVKSSSAPSTPTAKFDRATQHRRSMLAKINIARSQLSMVEDDYRQLLFDTTGKLSLKECSEPQLARMIDVLKTKGFKPMPGGRPKGAKGAAQHPVAAKARALWISLYQIGAVHNRAEAALEAFAKRQTGAERMAWMDQRQGYKLIEALKAMGARAGWTMHDRRTHAPLSPIGLQASLCEAILAKLKAAGLAPAEWALHEAAWKLCGIENAKDRPWIAEDYIALAEGLGAKLREHGR